MVSEHNDNIYFDHAAETLNWQERREQHRSRFQEFLEFVWRNSRSYQEIYKAAGIDIEDIRGLKDLPKLPVVRISDIVERQKKDPPFGGFCAIPPDKVRCIYVNPGLIWQPGDWEYLDSSWAEALCAAGFKRGDRILNTFNYHLWPIGQMIDESVRMIGATPIPTGAENILIQVKILQQLGVMGYLGTPSFLMSLSQRAEGMGLDIKKDLALKNAMVGAEMLPESLRRRLEEKLEMSIRQCYGTVFLGCVGYECIHMTGLHLPDSILVEVVDPKTGMPVKPGAIGEVVATNFSRSYPFIRLATGDLSLFIEEECPCGRTGPMLKKVLGRIDQATKVHGVFIHPWQTDEVIAQYPEVFKYQVIVTRENHVDEMAFRVELTEEVTDESILCRRIERNIKDIMTISGIVKVVPRGSIPDFHNKIEDRREWE